MSGRTKAFRLREVEEIQDGKFFVITP